MLVAAMRMDDDQLAIEADVELPRSGRRRPVFEVLLVLPVDRRRRQNKARLGAIRPSPEMVTHTGSEEVVAMKRGRWASGLRVAVEEFRSRSARSRHPALACAATFDGPQLDVATAVAALVVTTHVGFFAFQRRVEVELCSGSGTMAQWVEMAQVSLVWFRSGSGDWGMVFAAAVFDEAVGSAMDFENVDWLRRLATV